MTAGASRFDVAVVGGGSAGLAAAVAAAESGARTCLLERARELGGNATQAFVHTICGLYEPADAGPARFANPGFASRYARRLAGCGAAGEPERAGRVWVLPTEPPAMAAAAAEFAAATRSLDCRTGTRIVAAQLASQPGGESELVAACADGRSTVRARVVVDTSGDGVMAALGSADCASEPDSGRQAPSFIARVSGVAPGSVAGFARLQLSVSVAGASRQGRLPESCESILVRPGLRPGEVYLTLNLPPPAGREHALLDEDYLTNLRANALRWLETVLEFLRKQRPGFEHAVLAEAAARVGVRETRRLCGRVVLSGEHVRGGVRGANDVAVSSWPIELWSDHRRPRFQHVEAPCGIPLDALRSRSHPELGMAGRCLSASHEALGALRVIGTALATGEAIGVAAARAVDSGVSLRDVSDASVRRELDAYRAASEA
ncbi:MAG: FAD-dependent oxidoreductase [Proteobacteria bacterium]|nr:FAD-dependent oxidoreductase [Pseudomonadota bacterium]